MSLYLASRRCIVMMVLANNLIQGEYSEITKTKCLSAVLIVSGTVYAALDTLSNNPLGYLCVFIVNTLNIVSNSLAKRVQKRDKSIVDVITTNAGNNLPILVLLAGSEATRVSAMQYHLSAELPVLLAYMAVLTLTSYFYNTMFFISSKTCSHFSICIAGIFKDFLFTLLGTYMFQDVEVS